MSAERLSEAGPTGLDGHVSDPHSFRARFKMCDDLRSALQGDIGEIVAKVEKMILAYYGDVQAQATKSFESAKVVSKIGFGVLIATVGYALLTDFIARFHMWGHGTDSGTSLTIGGIGIVSGFLIEFIAGVNFWLYGKASWQFSAFHICLERTHRYLIAYKIAAELRGNKDAAMEKLVCIMANALGLQ